MHAGSVSTWGTHWGASGLQRSLLDNTGRFDGSDRSTSKSRGRMRVHVRSSISVTFACVLFAWISLVSSVGAAWVTFDNCLDQSTIDSEPKLLQFVPYRVWTTLDVDSPSKHLNISIYGNVNGTTVDVSYPAPDDPSWSNPNDTLGKIVDLSTSNNKYSTLLAHLQTLSFTTYDAPAERFCEELIHGECPLAPVFTGNMSDPANLRAFSISHDLYSRYAFATISSTIRVKTGDASNADLACISVGITPDLGSTIRSVLRYLPLVILILVGVATVTAATYCPWGTPDLFRWSSNYGRDEDILRLVTPGFGDCLQYIQFIVLTGGLSLNYPGYYQPVVSQAGWSSLMFNQSLVSNGNGSQPLVDGVYAVNATYGLERLSLLVGMTEVRDMWAGMVVWLLVILGSVTLLIQLGFGFRWIYRQLARVPEEDLRSKNWPFTVGNSVRIVFNFFLLPVVSLSMFQLVVTRRSPAYTVVLAVVLLAAVVGYAIWLLRFIVATRPRSFLFDDLQTVLLFGPLYNTYTDNAALFALIPVMVTIIRGVAIGAVQPTGIAQLILLAICEVVMVLTLNAFRPFHSATSMNAYHTFFSCVRLTTILLMVAFVPQLGVTEEPRGWIGYVVLLLHAIVLVFGFFLNAIQTLVEVFARLAGAGDESGSAARGGLTKVFGMRQLSRRVPRSGAATRQSMGSEAAILGNDREVKTPQFDGHARSLSGGSGMLLDRAGASDGRISVGYETGSAHGFGHSRGSGSGPYTPTTLGGYSHIPGHHNGGGGSPRRSAIIGIKQAETSDPYYRPPRQRSGNFDSSSPANRSRGSWQSVDGTKGRSVRADGDDLDPLEGPSGRGTPTPAHLGAPKDDSDEITEDPRHSRTDYAVREVDFYYRVRGPALSNGAGTRKLKTGPADPTGPVSSASGWVRRLFGGKTKDKAKGFEVVRSSRAPPPGLIPSPEGEVDEPYSDNPDGRQSQDEAAKPSGEHERRPSEVGGETHEAHPDTETTRGDSVPFEFFPALPDIETGGAIELPSRMGSKASHAAPHALIPPDVPRKSSRRRSAEGGSQASEISQASDDLTLPRQPHATASPALYDPDNRPGRLAPTDRIHAERLPFGPHSVKSSQMSTTSTADEDNDRDSYRRPSVFGSVRSDAGSQRASMGYVSHHRASDHIQISPEDTSFTGSSAEVINREHHPS